MRKIVLALALILVGCYAPPPLTEFKDEFTTGAEFQKTWSAVVDVLSAENWPIESIEKESGLVTTDWLLLGAETPDCSCPGSPLAVWKSHRGKVSIFVRASGEGSSLRIRCHFEGFDSNIAEQWTPCNSLGVIEQALSRKILAITGP